MPRRAFTADERDVVYARRFYLYTRRAGVCAGVKRRMRRRERHEALAELRRGADR